MRFSVGDEVDLVLPLLLLQAVFGATVVTHAAAAQNEDDRPNHPKPCETQTGTLDPFRYTTCTLTTDGPGREVTGRHMLIKCCSFSLHH